MNRFRIPYVGEGASGCERSAVIDRDEADTLDRSDERHALLLASADAWREQARILRDLSEARLAAFRALDGMWARLEAVGSAAERVADAIDKANSHDVMVLERASIALSAEMDRLSFAKRHLLSAVMEESSPHA